MATLKRALKKLDGIPLEWIFLTFPFLVIYLGLAVYWILSSNLEGFKNDIDLLKRLLLGIVSGGTFFSDFILFCYVAILVVSLIVLYYIIFKTKLGKKYYPLKDLLVNIGKIFLWLFSVTTASVGALAVLGVMANNLSLEKIIWATKVINDISLTLFKVEVSFFLQSIPYPNILGALFVYSYLNMGTLLSLALLMSLFLNSVVFRKLIFALIIAPAISLPIWYSLPAVSPFSAEIRNVFDVERPADYYPSEGVPIIEPVKKQFPLFDKMWIDKERKSYDISSLPSMHVAWGTVILLTMFALSRWLGIIFIPWWIMNAIGAVMTFQHYVLDVLAGALVGLISWYLVGKLQVLNEKRGDVYGLNALLSIPSNFVQKWFRRLRIDIRKKIKIF